MDQAAGIGVQRDVDGCQTFRDDLPGPEEFTQEVPLPGSQPRPSSESDYSSCRRKGSPASPCQQPISQTPMSIIRPPIYVNPSCLGQSNAGGLD
jgi:hypothetical protein